MAIPGGGQPSLLDNFFAAMQRVAVQGVPPIVNAPTPAAAMAPASSAAAASASTPAAALAVAQAPGEQQMPAEVVAPATQQTPARPPATPQRRPRDTRHQRRPRSSRHHRSQLRRCTPPSGLQDPGRPHGVGMRLSSGTITSTAVGVAHGGSSGGQIPGTTSSTRACTAGAGTTSSTESGLTSGVAASLLVLRWRCPIDALRVLETVDAFSQASCVGGRQQSVAW